MRENSIPITETTFFILSSLVEKPRHGYSIMKEVERISVGRIEMATGTLYSALKRLLDSGWIERIDAPELEPEDLRDRKYYQLTDVGKHVLGEEIIRIKNIAIMIKKLELGKNP